MAPDTNKKRMEATRYSALLRPGFPARSPSPWLAGDHLGRPFQIPNKSGVSEIQIPCLDLAPLHCIASPLFGMPLCSSAHQPERLLHLPLQRRRSQGRQRSCDGASRSACGFEICSADCAPHPPLENPVAPPCELGRQPRQQMTAISNEFHACQVHRKQPRQAGQHLR